MKTFLVCFNCGNGIFSSNMIWSNTGVSDQESVQEAAERHASRFGYQVSSIRELSECEVNSNLRRGMPYYSAEKEV